MQFHGWRNLLRVVAGTLLLVFPKALRTLIVFFVKQRIVGFDIPTRPIFDSDETTRWFATRLAQAKYYVEFGSGGSTYLAAELKIKFQTVDSDEFFLNNLKRKIQKNNLYNEQSQAYTYANIGITGVWGHPLSYGNPSLARLEKYRKYSDPPFTAKEKKDFPDFILIDGRFRVACTLKMLKILPANSDWVLAVDDYRDREEYLIIEKFAKRQCFIGRMAIFSEPAQHNLEQLDPAISHYELIPE
jgi:hypothetical protein